MKLKSMIIILTLIIIINTITISPIYAMSNIIKDGQNFLNKGQLVDDVIDTEALKSTSDFIFNMFLTIAIVLAIGIGTVLGIKFITSSVEGQAKIKEALVPYVVGCVVIFAAFPIWSFMVNVGQESTGTTMEDESVVYYCHSPNNWDGCDYSLSVSKQYLQSKAEDYDTIRKQCPVCYSITVFDTKTYETSRLEWAKCIECDEYIQLKLSDLQNSDAFIGEGTVFYATCANGHTHAYQYTKTKIKSTNYTPTKDELKKHALLDQHADSGGSGQTLDELSEEKIFLKHRSWCTDKNKEYITKKSLYIWGYDTMRKQCKTCWAITVFDAVDYTNHKILTFPKCSQDGCEEYLQLNLAHLQLNGTGTGHYFYATCWNNHKNLCYYESDYEIVTKNPDEYNIKGTENSVILKDMLNDN